MRYIFENENALELYYHITKEMNVKLVPHGFEDEVYISEEFMNECMKDIITKDKRFKKQVLIAMAFIQYKRMRK